MKNVHQDVFDPGDLKHGDSTLVFSTVWVIYVTYLPAIGSANTTRGGSQSSPESPTIAYPKRFWSRYDSWLSSIVF